MVECTVVGGGIEDHRGGEGPSSLIVGNGGDFTCLRKEARGILQGGEIFLEDGLANSCSWCVLIECNEPFYGGGDFGEIFDRAFLRQGVDFTLSAHRDVWVEILEMLEDGQQFGFGSGV